MRDRNVVIRNIHVMMAYAFRTVRGTGPAQIDAEPFEHLHDLFAEILVRGVAAQVKRGLHHDYLHHEERLAAVRGRIDIGRTAMARASAPGSAMCSFDEYEPDTAYNRALKSVLVLLLRHGEVTRPRKDAIRRVLMYLDAVTLVPVGSIRWKQLHHHRATATYRLLLGVCELVVRGLLPTEAPGSHRLTSWLSDETMSVLYERFLREYYAYHHPELHPAARNVEWDLGAWSGEDSAQLPAMRTDVTLQRGGRTLIIDAKYYQNPVQTGRFGKSTIRSDHLYQIFAYAKNADPRQRGDVSALLLYAQTDGSITPSLDVVVQGSRLGARALNLYKPWPKLKAELEGLLSWLDLHQQAPHLARPAATRTHQPS